MSRDLVASLSNGNLIHVSLAGGIIREWKAHDYEAWICAADRFDVNAIYSGGDDCRLNVWDLRGDCSRPSITCKSHEMGVTAIQAHPSREHLFSSGRWDFHC